jgi:hypothetical protein
MDYQFTMTPRLIAISVIGFISLLFLLFALGFQFGQQWGADEIRLQSNATAPSQLSFPVVPPAFPAQSTMGTPAPPLTAAGPTPSPLSGGITAPSANPSGTLGKPN